jgi:glycerol transport system permease protein
MNGWSDKGRIPMDKWVDNKAWFLVMPVFVVVAFSAIIPLMTVVNYSIQDIFGPGNAVFVGTEWFKDMLTNKRLHDALGRQFLFSGLVLLIEIPLGILIALAMPKKGWGVSASLVTLAIPLLIPWNVIGTIWIIFHPAGHRPVRGLASTAWTFSRSPSITRPGPPMPGSP